MKIEIKTPAKINLDLKVDKKRGDGFHPIVSIMQSVDLFDYITIETAPYGISLTGNSKEIPYDEKNIAHKATKLFFSKFREVGIKINIEKNIPVCAGLAGGSTNGAGVLYGLNEMFDRPYTNEELHKMCATLGSDLNFCLVGGKCLCKGRGELIEKLPFEEFSLILVKPKNLKISAREAYEKFDELKKPSTFKNDLEFALIEHYKELKTLHNLGFQMSGSGPTFFIEEEKFIEPPLDCEIFKGLKAIEYGVIKV